MSKEIEWFCYHAVLDNMLSADDCRAVLDAMREAGVEEDLAIFAQAVVDNELSQDVERIEELMGMAVEKAKTLGFPPQSIPEESVADDQIETGAGADEAAGEEDSPQEIEEENSSGFVLQQAFESNEAQMPWCTGWPRLADTERATPEKARQLMNAFLAKAREMRCSDVHVSAGACPFVRRHKANFLLYDQGVLTPEASEMANLSLLNDEQRGIFEKTHDLDYSHSVSINERFRTNVMLQRIGVAGSYRIIDNQIRSLKELGFLRTEVIEKLTTYHQGLILVTGPAGCGKSTTLAALVDLINRKRQDHIITVEDPIEYVHPPKQCNVTQREVGSHTRSFANALRAALREDPDIIVIGELRDLETIEMAIRASETGHLVFGTLHTGNAASTMDRVLDVFPPNQQAQIRAMAAESLKGVICQRLLPNADETGVVLAAEIMLGTLAVGNTIRDGETFKLPSIIQTGYKLGMCSFEQSLFDLFMAGKRTYDQTLPHIKSADLIRQMQMREAQKAADAAGLKKKRGIFG